MKKIISMILCLALVMGLSVPVLALEESEEMVAIEGNRSEIPLGDGTLLIGEDLPNGDARFSIVEGNKVISEEYLDRSQNTITSTDYVTGEVETTTVPVQEQTGAITEEIGLREGAITPLSFVRCGAITYNFYGGNAHVTGTRKVNVFYDYSYVAGTQYNVRGTFKSQAAFASYLASWLAIPAGVASPLAAAIITGLGLAAGTASYVVPDHYVKCNKTTMTWKGVYANASDVYGTFTGTQYVVVGDTNKTYKQGDYWPQSSYSNRNTSFATHLYTAVFGQDIVEIVSWG